MSKRMIAHSLLAGAATRATHPATRITPRSTTGGRRRGALHTLHTQSSPLGVTHGDVTCTSPPTQHIGPPARDATTSAQKAVTARIAVWIAGTHTRVPRTNRSRTHSSFERRRRRRSRPRAAQRALCTHATEGATPPLPRASAPPATLGPPALAIPSSHLDCAPSSQAARRAAQRRSPTSQAPHSARSA